ncbi:MAG: cysteine desulfurase family protein [bacterium]
MDHIYMDYGSASPVDQRVIEAMHGHSGKLVGNPFSVHSGGRLARHLLEEARNKVSSLIAAEDGGKIIFTSGATEANNLALIGTALRGREKGNRIIISAIEHISVINAAKSLAKQGFEIVTIPVDDDGLLNTDLLQRSINDKTILVSIMHANGEIGTVQPIWEIGAITRDKGVPLHVDATAAAGNITINADIYKIDLLTISSNDLYGPQGAGALYVGPKVKIQPVILGGGQQNGLRSGAENLAGIVGFGKACEIAQSEMFNESAWLQGLRDELIEGVLNNIDRAYLTGSRYKRLPNHASFRFDYIEGESIILSLDMEGILASTGSACSSKTLEPSHVLLALGLSHEQAHGSLVLRLGRWSTRADVDAVLEVLPPIIKRLRAMSPLVPRMGAQHAGVY